MTNVNSPNSIPSRNLGLAVISTSVSPLLLLDKGLSVIAASASFCRAFDLSADAVTGRQLSELGQGEWKLPQLNVLLNATILGYADVDSYEMDLNRKDHTQRHLVLNARKLDYGTAEDAYLTLAVLDVTDLRASERVKDDLIREKAVLLQEIQHRVANSLQIIASVLLQSARKVQTDEARSHLTSAHGRVLSVAAVQRQLAATGTEEVVLSSYFTQLCQSLGASMIHDPSRISIKVKVDDSVVSSTVSVSLGLIVTELVINALKHGFPDNRRGQVVVDYGADGADWTLSVTDNGIGMPKDPAEAAPGLGTGIVEALAKQLQADVQVVDARPGTSVSIVYLDLIAMAA